MATSDHTLHLPLRVIIWVSVSTKVQTKEDKASLPEQEREATEFAEREGWQIIDILRVPGHSRRYIDIHDCNRDMLANKIDAFDRMLQHWQQRDFDVLIVRDGDRFARTQSLHAYVVERTIDECNARIYVTTNGWVDRSNFRMFTAMDGYSSASHVDGLIKKGKATKTLRTSQGLPTAAHPPFSHIILRDPNNGKRIGIEVDESKRRLFDDVATLVIEGHGWDGFEKELYRRFGHVDPRTGKPFKYQFFYRLLRNPWFWGNAARNYNAPITGMKLDIWAFDETIPTPEGVMIWRNTHEPVFKGEQAALVRAELRRRSLSIRGTAHSYHTHKFSGLVICGYCGYRMSYNLANGKYAYFRCFSKYKDRLRPACERGRTISENKVKNWLNARLTHMLESSEFDLLARDEKQDSVNDHANMIRTEIQEVEAQTRRLIQKQSVAPDALAGLYDEELKGLAERLTNLRSALLNAELRVARADLRPVQRAYEQLKTMSLTTFWLQDSTVINQLLHRLMGNKCLVVMDCEIVGVTDAPIRKST